LPFIFLLSLVDIFLKMHNTSYVYFTQKMKIHTSGARHLGIFLPNFTLLLKLLTGAISSFAFDGQNWKGRASSSQRKRNLCDSVGNRPLTLILTPHTRIQSCVCVWRRQNPLQKITSLLNYCLNMRLVL